MKGPAVNAVAIKQDIVRCGFEKKSFQNLSGSFIPPSDVRHIECINRWRIPISGFLGSRVHCGFWVLPGSHSLGLECESVLVTLRNVLVTPSVSFTPFLLH